MPQHTYGPFPEGSQPPRQIRHAKNAAQARHAPRTYWDAQTTQDQMVRQMTPVEFTDQALEEHRSRFDEAARILRKVDVHRVLHMTDLHSPF